MSRIGLLPPVLPQILGRGLGSEWHVADIRLHNRVRASLKMLEEQFSRAAGQHKPLFHDLLTRWPDAGHTWADGLTDDEDVVRRFLSRQTNSSGAWQEWHGPHRFALKGHWLNESLTPPQRVRFTHDLFWCGRFHGSSEGMSEFKPLAESLYLVLAKWMDLAVDGGWPGMLLMLHAMSKKQPTPLIRAEEGLWNWEPYPDDDRAAQQADREAASAAVDDDGVPLHPTVWRLKSGLFTTGATAIRYILDAGSMLLVGDDGAQAGMSVFLPSLVDSPLAPEGHDESPSLTAVGSPARGVGASAREGRKGKAQRLRPRWDREERKLYVGSHLVKHFRQRADNQQAILDAFQEARWSTRVDDPLPPARDVDPKARLRDAVKALNARHKTRNCIRFEADGTGEGITYSVCVAK